jgi:hypothetical protein
VVLLGQVGPVATDGGDDHLLCELHASPLTCIRNKNAKTSLAAMP